MHDVRARRFGLDALVLLHRGRRLLSAVILVALDLTGVTLALYAALVLRNAYRGEQVLFGLPWAAISNWLQFIALVLVLVFARAGLYRQREARPGADATIRSLALVTIITAFYAIAVAGMTFHSFYGIFWVTFVLAAILVPLLRASYDSVTLELMRLLGVRRRTVLVGPVRRAVRARARAASRWPRPRPRRDRHRQRAGRRAGGRGLTAPGRACRPRAGGRGAPT